MKRLSEPELSLLADIRQGRITAVNRQAMRDLLDRFARDELAPAAATAVANALSDSIVSAEMPTPADIQQRLAELLAEMRQSNV